MSLKISVVMPVYNGMPYVKKAIDSILAQSFPPHEIIIVDDGSKDSTPELLKSYGDKIIVRRIPNSGGPATPKSVGMALATGDYIAFLDHDDVWFKDKLKRQAELAIEYPDAGVICCNYAVRYPHLGWRMARHFSELRQKNKIKFDEPLKTHPFLLLIHENFVGTPSAVLLKKSLAEKVGSFRKDYGPCDDYSYWIQCAVNGDFILVSDLLMYKRTHVSNMSLDAEKIYVYHKKILEDLGQSHLVFMKDKGWVGMWRDAISECERILGNLAYEKGETGKAFKLFWKSFTNYPTPVNALFFISCFFKKLLRMVTVDLFRKAVRAR